jgi:hypothetical protein
VTHTSKVAAGFGSDHFSIISVEPPENVPRLKETIGPGSQAVSMGTGVHDASFGCWCVLHRIAGT